MPAPSPLIIIIFFFLSNSAKVFFFFSSFSCTLGWELGVPQAAVPGGNIVVAMT